MKKVVWLLLLCAIPFLFCGKKRKTTGTLNPLLARLAPANQLFRIDPGQKNILRAEKGSYFTIESDSFTLPDGFGPGEKIDIHIVEVTRSLEFGAVPVSLEFNHKGKDTLFESAGMFFINATYKDAPLMLKKDKKIEVKFRTKIQGSEFYVYAHDAAKGWVRHGHNREIHDFPGLIAQAAGTEARDSQPIVVGGDERAPRGRRRPISPAKPAVAAPAAAAQGALYRVYKIDRLTWWNFDYPKPNLTCLKGKITGSDSEYYSVTVFSKSELGAYTLSLEKDFRISFYRNTIARVVVIDEKGNVAKTPFFETSDEIGHHKLPDSKCEDVGPLKIEKIPEEISKDDAKLRKYFQKAGDGT